jgi:RNA polymerase sigma-70 factor (ECF subfamily)
VYAYVAYRVGEGPDAEDITSAVFENALRYRSTYDPSRGEPATWLLGIARRCVTKAFVERRSSTEVETEAPLDVEHQVLQRLMLQGAVATLSERERDLIALRYGADLGARQIAELLGLTTNAVEVALHRALSRLRTTLEHPLRGEGDLPVVGPAEKPL